MFHFSKRTDWELSENPLSLLLKELKKQGASIIDLTESNPTRCGFDYPSEIILPPLGDEKNLVYAPDPKGLLKVREALTAYYAVKAVTLSPENFILTSSTSEGYSFLFRLLMEPGDKVLLPAPSYPLFSYLAGLNDVEVDHYFLRREEDVWRINFESIEHALDTKTRAIILVSPNNPTGSCIKKEELAQLNDLAQAHNLALICDEVFADYILEEQKDSPYLSLASNSAVPTFVLGGLSKALALPQMKLSWIAVNGSKDYLQEALPRLEVIADTYLSVNTPVQNAAAGWLKAMPVIRDQILARLRSNYAFLRHAITEAGAGECLFVEGGWYAVVKIPSALPEDEWAISLLQTEHVYVHPGFFFDFDEEGYFVLSLLPEEHIFQDGVNRLCRAVRKKSSS